MRARDLGIRIGLLQPGPLNAITDVAGVRVGHTTLVEGEGPLIVGKGPVRTGVTVIRPHDGDPHREAVFAGTHQLNGNGEFTGWQWIRESGLLTTPIAITNTSSVGTVRDGIISFEARARRGPTFPAGCSGHCRSLARPGTAISMTPRASTSGPSTSMPPWSRQRRGPWRRETSAAGPA